MGHDFQAADNRQIVSGYRPLQLDLGGSANHSNSAERNKVLSFPGKLLEPAGRQAGARSSVVFFNLMSFCRAPAYLLTGLQHLISGAQNCAGGAIQGFPVNFSGYWSNIVWGATGAVKEGLKLVTMYYLSPG
jgi:hypothetical protein